MIWTSSTEKALKCIYHLPQISHQAYYKILYAYNRLPLTFLKYGPIEIPHHSHFHSKYESWDDGYWYHTIRNEGPILSNKMVKLYLAIDPRFLYNMIEKIIPPLMDLKPIGMKWGAKPNYLLRSDRFIVYFESLNKVKNASIKVSSGMDQTSFQEVPFTLKISKETPFSYGIDPANASENHVSWRSEICNKIASLAQNKHSFANYETFKSQAFHELDKHASNVSF